MSAHSNSVCIRYWGACCNEGAYLVGVLVIIKKRESRGRSQAGRDA